MNHVSKYTLLVVKDLIAYQFGDNSQIKEKLGSNLTQSEVDKLLKFNQVSGDTVILEESEHESRANKAMATRRDRP